MDRTSVVRLADARGADVTVGQMVVPPPPVVPPAQRRSGWAEGKVKPPSVVGSGASVASGATIRERRQRLGGASCRLLGCRAHLRRAATARAKLFGTQRAAIHEDLLGVL